MHFVQSVIKGVDSSKHLKSFSKFEYLILCTFTNELKQVANVFCLLQGSGDKVDDWLQLKLQSGKTWEGPINCARKTGDFVPLNTRVIPVMDNKTKYEHEDNEDKFG